LALNALVHLLRKLGFMINWSKVVDPTSSITFLGIEIDSSTMELRLPADKLFLLRLELDDFKVRKQASKKQLQSLAGKLNWASAVIRGGRVFLRRIIDCITSLKRDWHKILLKGEVLADIVDAVGEKIEVHMDGGIRSGQDVLKAKCIGAKGVYIGRPYIYGLAAQGKKGVAKALEIIRYELDLTMALCGERDVNNLDRTNLYKFTNEF